MTEAMEVWLLEEIRKKDFEVHQLKQVYERLFGR